MREVPVDWMLRNHMTVGGRGLTVETDKSEFSKRKQPWLDLPIPMGLRCVDKSNQFRVLSSRIAFSRDCLASFKVLFITIEWNLYATLFLLPEVPLSYVCRGTFTCGTSVADIDIIGDVISGILVPALAEQLLGL
uniref:Uncharacterized protein n=1 Tax=Trichuris muris TaxID=70415 RepID=A0A5S6QAS8_TRIMR